MEEKLRVTLVANAGLLLEYEGTTMLLDGIFNSGDVPFSNLSQERWEQMLRGEPPFQKVDYLLFSHYHPDHFSPEMTLEYLRSRPVKGLFLPDAQEVAESPLGQWLRGANIPCVVLSDETAIAAWKIAPHISVRAFRTQHLDKVFASVRHYCYLITFGEKTVLFTADTDYTTEDFASLNGKRLHAAFINPLFFSALCHGKFFHGKLDVEQLCIYHIPFAEDDSMGMRMVLAHDLAGQPDAVVLDTPLCCVEL